MAFLVQKLIFVTVILVLWCLIDTEAGECSGTAGISYPGSDIQTSPGVKFSLEDSKRKCCKRCKDTPNCVAWVYHDESKRCFAKKNIGKEKTWPEGYKIFTGVL
ncbi:uncharacterized protein LOC144451440 [Glandiceps talaboti]